MILTDLLDNSEERSENGAYEKKTVNSHQTPICVKACMKMTTKAHLHP